MTEHVASPLAAKYLQLHLADGVGPILLARLLETFGDIDAVLHADRRHLESVRGVGPKIAEAILAARDPRPALDEIQRAAQHNVRILCLADPDYPMALRHTPDPPTCLYVRGALHQADAIGLAIVGSRRASTYGLEQARRFGQLLGQAGFTVVSGLAYGVDSAAHRGALDVNARTMAVLGNGLASIYPPQHRDLANAVARQGALISECPMTAAPDRGAFPARNRIIAGMTLGTLVIEGDNKSGALITANLANDYNREVFAIPGPVNLPNAIGPNTLIQKSLAKLVMSLDDILDELGPVGHQQADHPVHDPTAPTPRPAPANLAPDERQILAVLTPDHAIGIETVAQLANLTPARTAGALTMLQLKGAVKQLPGMQCISLVQPQPAPQP